MCYQTFTNSAYLTFKLLLEDVTELLKFVTASTFWLIVDPSFNKIWTKDSKSLRILTANVDWHCKLCGVDILTIMPSTKPILQATLSINSCFFLQTDHSDWHTTNCIDDTHLTSKSFEQNLFLLKNFLHTFS
jgi:hypothetical protein